MKTARPLFAALLLAAALHAQEAVMAPKAVLKPEPVAAPEVGVPIPLRIYLPAGTEAEAVEVSLPKDQSFLALVGAARRDGTSFLAELRVLKTGDVSLGPATVTATLADGRRVEFPTAEVALAVAELAGEAGEARDYTAPAIMPYDWFWRNLAYGAGALLIAAAGGYAVGAWLDRRKAVALPAAQALLPPIDEALQAVRGLRTMRVFDASGPEQHYTALSMAVRRYIERAYGVAAMELSDDEMVRMLRRDFAHRAASEPLSELFTRSSLAKFARQPLEREVASADAAAAELFLDAERARGRAAETAGGAAA
ncbi:MAG: hypothetical protein SF028_01985 [Candidatus Sumerlaeia bacterium]|nr:hypothetical protein [Candidatus Sumerlaeia bacterium]